MNTDIRKNAKNGFEKDFFQLMNNVVFGKTMKNKGKHEDIKLVKQKVEEITWLQNQIFILQSFSYKYALAIEMKKTEIIMNKPVYSRLSILELSGIFNV